MKESAEEIYIRHIENGIRAIRMGTKEPKDTLAPVSLNKLKQINLGLYEDYLDRYKNVLKEYNKRKGGDETK
jgi:hypothetical protein